MEWEMLLIDALVGAVAGGLGAVLTRKLPPSKKSTRSVLSVALVVVGITVANQVIVPRVRAARAQSEFAKVGQEMFGSQQAADLYAASLTPIVNDPKFRERIAAMGKAPAATAAAVDGARLNATAQLVSAGMARLTDADREAFADLKVALGTHSVELCAAFWTGRLRVEDLTTGLHQLSEEQKAAWIRISMEALTRELHATSPVVAPPPEATADALKALQAALTHDEQAVFDRTSQAGDNATSKDACASFQMVLTHAKALPPAVRTALVRMMVVAPDGA